MNFPETLDLDAPTLSHAAIPKLLEMLDIKGRTVTMDGMGCQKEMAEQIVDKGSCLEQILVS